MAGGLRRLPFNPKVTRDLGSDLFWVREFSRSPASVLVATHGDNAGSRVLFMKPCLKFVGDHMASTWES